MNELTQETLKALLHYDPETGVFKWRGNRGAARAGDEAGVDNGTGYLRTKISGKSYLNHRLAWLYVHGCWPASDLDHINRRRTDNKISNLRLATRSENEQNKLLQRCNTSGFRGVSWSKSRNRWQASIMLNGKQQHLGYFAAAEEASLAYRAAAARLHTVNPAAFDIRTAAAIVAHHQQLDSANSPARA